jgi:phosphonate transport system substrate-binding protein
MGIVVVFLFLALFVPIPFIPNSPLFGAEPRPLVFGRVFDDPVRAIKDRQELVDYVAKKLAPFGITSGKILVVDRMRLLAQALRDGKVDFFHDSVAPTMVISKWAGSVPILRQWKYGTADYVGIIVVKKHSGITSLAGLKGKIIAFEEPHSTSASILPRMLLEENKLKLVHVKYPGTVTTDAIGYVYGSDGNSLNVLVTGRADAAATIHREFDRLKPEIRDSLEVIGTTMAAPRTIVAARKDLDPKLINGLKDVLSNLHNYPEGQEVLKRSQNTTRFDGIPPESLRQMKSIEKYVFSTLAREVDSW